MVLNGNSAGVNVEEQGTVNSQTVEPKLSSWLEPLLTSLQVAVTDCHTQLDELTQARLQASAPVFHHHHYEVVDNQITAT